MPSEPQDAGSLDELEREILGADRRYDRFEVAERSGMPFEVATTLWRALGFADVDDDDRAFTDRDVEALKSVQALVDLGVMDERTQLGMTRAMGQALSRLAEWHVGALATAMADNPEFGTTEATAAAHELVPLLESLIGYVWRRHLAAVASRTLAGGADELVARTVVVGFVDMVGFTSLTRQVSDDELSRLVDAFESAAADVIAARSGRVIKLVGDEVMFTVDDPVTGAEIATEMAAAMAAIDDLPEIRMGLAYGSVLARLGDIYGEPVNIASRLTSIARPGSILVDRELASRLEDDERWTLSRVPPKPVRGYSSLQALRLRRANDVNADDGAAASLEP